MRVSGLAINDDRHLHIQVACMPAPACQPSRVPANWLVSNSAAETLDKASSRQPRSTMMRLSLAVHRADHHPCLTIDARRVNARSECMVPCSESCHSLTRGVGVNNLATLPSCMVVTTCEHEVVSEQTGRNLFISIHRSCRLSDMP